MENGWKEKTRRGRRMKRKQMRQVKNMSGWVRTMNGNGYLCGWCKGILKLQKRATFRIVWKLPWIVRKGKRWGMKKIWVDEIHLHKLKLVEVYFSFKWTVWIIVSLNSLWSLVCLSWNKFVFVSGIGYCVWYFLSNVFSHSLLGICLIRNFILLLTLGDVIRFTYEL